MDTEVKARKRQLEPDDEYYGEGDDQFDNEGTGVPRRGRKEGRRVSGVYREIKALKNIGANATVMELVFEKLYLKEVRIAAASAMNSMWYIVAVHEFRKRYGDRPFLRLWNSEKPKQYLWIEWHLYFHDELLAGVESMDELMETDNCSKVPCVDTIITIGSRSAYDQITHEDAKLPFRQDHIYLTCGSAIVTMPDFSYTGTVDSGFAFDSLVVQSLFIPKSPHVSLKAFALESSKDSWPLDQIQAKIELPAEDIGAGQELRAVLCIHYFPKGPTMSFVENFRSHYKSVGLLSGFAEEIGCNRISEMENPVAVGLSIYAGAGANISVYEVDFEQDGSEQILLKMENQAKTHANGFCFVCTNDMRNWVHVSDAVANEDEDWSDSVRLPSRTDEIIKNMRQRMPRTPIFGVDSYPFVTTETVDKSNSNVQDKSERRLCWGILLVTYD